MIASLKLLTILSLSLSCLSMFLPPTVHNEQDKQVKNLLSQAVAPGLKTIKGNFTANGCVAPYGFIGYDYVNNNSTIFNTICDQIEENLLYRLEAGASIQKVNGSCILSQNNVAVADKFLCALWNITTFNVVKGQSCPGNSSVIQAYDVALNRFNNQVCNNVGNSLITPTIAIAGFHGSVTVEDNSAFDLCIWNPWDNNSTYDSIVCVDPYLIDIQPINATLEKACGDGFSLLTLSEVYANQGAYWALNITKTYDVLRLSGDAAVGYDVMFNKFYIWSFEDGIDTKHAFCAYANRTSS